MRDGQGRKMRIRHEVSTCLRNDADTSYTRQHLQAIDPARLKFGCLAGLIPPLRRGRPWRQVSPQYPHGQVAQSVEQRTENPRVGSSILPLATNFDSAPGHQ
jgi:hypothetical protein